jgi:hypothetical protein
VPLSGDDDFKSDFLTARERDLRPLLRESTAELGLDDDQIVEMDRFLVEAWTFGFRAGHAQMRARAAQGKVDIPPVGIEEIEADFKSLMERSATALNLTVDRTVDMWAFLADAWTFGTNSSQAEIAARMIERDSDVAQEALRWLNAEDDDG